MEEREEEADFPSYCLMAKHKLNVLHEFGTFTKYLIYLKWILLAQFYTWEQSTQISDFNYFYICSAANFSVELSYTALKTPLREHIILQLNI